MNLPDGIRKKRSFLEIKYKNNWIAWNPYHSKLSAYILRVKFGNNGYFKKVAEMDSDIIKALEIFTSKN